HDDVFDVRPLCGHRVEDGGVAEVGGLEFGGLGQGDDRVRIAGGYAQPGSAASMPPVVTSTELVGSSDHWPISIVYQASVEEPGPVVPAATRSSPVCTPRAGLRVVRTVLMPSRVPTRISRASAGTRPLVTSVWAKTRTPFPHISDRLPSWL